MSSVTIYRAETTMRFDDNRQNLAGRVAESLAKVL